MNIAEAFFLAIAAALALLVLIRLFAAPLRLALKLVGNTVLGFFALLLFQFFDPWLGIHLGVNLINALVVGVLGLPGLALLVLLQWLFV